MLLFGLQRLRPGFFILLFCLFLNTGFAANENWEVEPFDDQTLSEKIELPKWFKLSFLDLQDDIDEAIAAGKRGLIVYFGRKDCPYCKALMENSWGRENIIAYTQKYYDVVAIDVKGDRSVTDVDGFVYDEKQYARKMKTNFTPSLIFFDKDGQVALRLTGYHAPYRFLAALEFVAGEHYKTESFRTYMAQAESSLTSGNEEINDNPVFARPPFAMDRSRFKSDIPLVVLFEHTQCHACDVLHSIPLKDKGVIKQLNNMEAVQLDMQSEEPLITPSGRKTTARAWAEELGLFYAPTLIFFDEGGKEIIRIDSIVWVHRLGNVLNYVLSKGYKDYSTFQAWQQRKR